MLVGLISDTHDHVSHIKEAVNIFKNRKVDRVLHAGDYCSPFTIPHFEGLPLKGIFGNNDGDKYLLMEKFRGIGADLEGNFLETEIDDLRIAVYHGTDAPITEALIHCGKYDVVVSGHTHERVNRRISDTLHINPGTANGFGEDATVALLDTDTVNVEFITLN